MSKLLEEQTLKFFPWSLQNIELNGRIEGRFFICLLGKKNIFSRLEAVYPDYEAQCQ